MNNTTKKIILAIFAAVHIGMAIYYINRLLKD